MTPLQKAYRKGRKIYKWFRNQKFLNQLVKDIQDYKYKKGLIKNVDFALIITVLLIAFFGVASIFAATAAIQTEEVSGLLNILTLNTFKYPGTQLMWMLVSFIAMCFVCYPDYHIYAKYTHILYYLEMGLLLWIAFFSRVGRGGMAAFLNIGNYGIQPSEFGKCVMVVALADLFAKRKEPIKNVPELLPSFGFVVIPAILVVLQPDFGTALVYVVIYIVLLWVSGTKGKLIWGTVAITVALAIPAWYYFNTTSGDFRLTRILMWLHPSRFPDDARQVINGQIALGTGGLLGKGIVSVGSYASLGFIPDDHTDFCFAILCEAFGFIGAFIVIAGYAFIIFRMFSIARNAMDDFGQYIAIGVAAIFMFHVIENIGMIIGLLPVTGIPLPFISYGGSNCLTNFIAIGLVTNVVMRSKETKLSGHNRYTKAL